MLDKSRTFTCYYCKGEFIGHGRNPDRTPQALNDPNFSGDEECCGVCDDLIVIPGRLQLMLGIQISFSETDQKK
jgi:hypothetical protein